MLLPGCVGPNRIRLQYPFSVGKNKSKKSRKGGNRTINPAATAMQYFGPITPMVPGIQPITRMMTYAASQSSNPAGTIAAGVTIAVTSLTEWSTISNLWREYRILGAKMKWIPNFAGYSTASTPPLSAMAVLSLSRDGTITPPTSVLLALPIAPRVVSTISSRMSLTYRMNGPLESSFHNTDAPAVGVATFCLNSDLLSVSAFYGTLQMDVMVQFRNPV